MGRTPDLLVTVWWRSPELWCGYEAYGVASDMWSLGCIAYEIVLRDFPFDRDPVTGSPMMDVGERFGLPALVSRVAARRTDRPETFAAAGARVCGRPASASRAGHHRR